MKEFKSNRRKSKIVSIVSAEIDVTNILDVIKWRNGAGASIWQTNEFMVSADQGLIAWAAKVYPGVPIVVLPSVWLSLILRFTGRTDDDYKSFCLFLTQRQHISHENVVDPTRVLSVLKYQTSDQKLKEQIIIELTQNKESYTFNTDDDYDVNVVRAFDKVVEDMYGRAAQDIETVKAEMKLQLAHLAQTAGDEAKDRAKMEGESARQRTIDSLAKKKADDVQRKWHTISKFDWILYILTAIFMAGWYIVWVFEIEPIFSWGLDFLPPKFIKANNFDIAWTVLSAAVGLLFLGVRTLVKRQCSEDKKLELIEKYRREFQQATEI